MESKEPPRILPLRLGDQVAHTPLEPRPLRVPQADCGAAEGAGDEVPENERLLGLECRVSCERDPNLMIQEGPPTPHPSQVHSGNVTSVLYEL